MRFLDILFLSHSPAQPILSTQIPPPRSRKACPKDQVSRPPPSRALHVHPTEPSAGHSPKELHLQPGPLEGPKFMTDQSSWWSDHFWVCSTTVRGPGCEKGGGQVIGKGAEARGVSPQSQPPSHTTSAPAALSPLSRMVGGAPGMEIPLEPGSSRATSVWPTPAPPPGAGSVLSYPGRCPQASVLLRAGAGSTPRSRAALPVLVLGWVPHPAVPNSESRPELWDALTQRGPGKFAPR